VEIAFFSGGLQRRSAPTASGKAGWRSSNRAVFEAREPRWFPLHFGDRQAASAVDNIRVLV